MTAPKYNESRTAAKTLSNKPRRILKWFTAIALTVTIALTTGGYWLLTTPSGFYWLLSTAERASGGTLHFEAIDGTATDMQIGKLQFADESTQLHIERFAFRWTPRRLLNKTFHVHAITFGSIAAYTEPSDDETTLPEDLSLPIDIVVEKLTIGALHTYSDRFLDTDEVEAPQPDFSLTDLTLQLDSNAVRHRIGHVALQTPFGALRASAEIASAQPFALQSVIRFDAPEHWGTADIAATGTLAHLQVKLRHRLEHPDTPSQVFLDAQLQPFAPQPVAMITALKAAIIDFNPAAFFPDAPQARLTLHTALRQQADSRLNGTLALINTAIAPLDQAGLPLEAVRTAIAVSENALELNRLNITLAGNASISGGIDWQLDEEYGQAHLDIASLNPAALDTQLQAAHIGGSIRLNGDADRQRIEAGLRDDALKLRLDAAAEHHASRVILERIDLQHGQSRFTAKGELSLPGDLSADEALPFHFTGQLRQFNVADFVQDFESNLNLKLTLTGQLLPGLNGVLDYQFDDSHFKQQSVGGKGRVVYAQPLSVTSDATLQIGANHVRIDGKYGKPGDRLSLQLNAPALEQTGFGLSGAVNAQFNVRSTANLPAIEFDLNSTQLTLPDNQSIGSLAGSGNVQLDQQELALTLSAKQFSAQGSILAEQFDLSIDGQASEHVLLTALRIDSEQTVTVQANGALSGHDKPGATPNWQGQLTQLLVTGPLPVQLQKPAALVLGSDKVTLDNARFSIANGEVELENVFWSPKKLQTQGRFSGISVHPGSDLVAKENMLQLRGSWDIQAQQQLTGTIDISRENGDWYLPGELPHPIGLQRLQLTVQASDGELSGLFDLDSTQIGTATAKIALPITASAQYDFFPPHTALDGSLNVKSTDLSWLGTLTDSTLYTDGQIELETTLGGTMNEPTVQGRLIGQKLALALLDEGLNLDQGELAIRFDQTALHIDTLRFVSPYEAPPKDRLLKKLKLEKKPGSVDITGSLGFADNAHQLTVTLEQVYLDNPPHYWIVASGESTAQMRDNVLNLEGEITTDAGIITQPPITRPQLAEDIVVVDKNVHTADGQESEDEQPTVVNLDVALNLGKQFFLRVAGLEGRLDGSLQLYNDDNNGLSAVGSIATKKTTYRAYGQDLTVERGIVNFHGPLDDPGLNVRAVRKGLAVEAGVEVAGSVRHPKIQLVATPHVPDTEKLSWIVLGRAPDASGLDSSLLLTAASSILGGESGFGVTDRIQDFFGLDELSLRQGGNQTTTQANPFSNPYAYASSTLSGQIGTVGKRISSRAYLSYERGITAATTGITKLTYSLTPTVTVVTQAGEDSAIDLFYTFRFD